MSETVVACRVDAPSHAVWACLSDVMSWPQWLPTVRHVQALDAPALGMARRYRLHQPGLRPTVWTVRELEPGTAFTWVARAPGLRLQATHRLSAPDARSTQLRLEFRVFGALAAPFTALFKRRIEHALRCEAEALKACSEAAHHRPAATGPF